MDEELNAVLPSAAGASGDPGYRLHLPCKKCHRFFEVLTDGQCQGCYRPPPAPIPEVKWDDVCPMMKVLVEGLVEVSGGAFTGSGGSAINCLGPRDVPGRRSVHFRVPLQDGLRRRVSVEMTEAEYDAFRRWCAGRSITFQEYT